MSRCFSLEMSFKTMLEKHVGFKIKMNNILYFKLLVLVTLTFIILKQLLSYLPLKPIIDTIITKSQVLMASTKILFM